MEKVVWQLGRFLGKVCTTKHNIEGEEIPNSQQVETIEFLLLDDLSELFMDLTFVATDNVDYEVLLNENKLFDTYLFEDKNGLLGLETAFIDDFGNLKRMLSFLFKTIVDLKELTSNKDKQVYDLTEYKQNCITIEELDTNYQEWIKISSRENTMDEYGSLIGIIGYINRNNDKTNLVLITEKRKHYC